MTVRLVMLLIAGALAVSCGRDDDGPEIIRGFLQIDISTPSYSEVYSTGSEISSIQVGGTVSESPYGKVQETVCNCAGFACFFNPDCTTMYFPRVNVTVRNLETGQSVAATLPNSSYSQSGSGYTWEATIPLVSGSNRINAEASDGMGFSGSDSITIENP